MKRTHDERMEQDTTPEPRTGRKPQKRRRPRTEGEPFHLISLEEMQAIVEESRRQLWGDQ
jgi:hypothetical protein